MENIGNIYVLFYCLCVTVIALFVQKRIVRLANSDTTYDPIYSRYPLPDHNIKLYPRNLFLTEYNISPQYVLSTALIYLEPYSAELIHIYDIKLLKKNLPNTIQVL